ncbi:DUF192 domain-containing protein [Patescibacteria group bacterium]|nr:DUF192 domain-containing protein [Patescibacteria group bacterium]
MSVVRKKLVFLLVFTTAIAIVAYVFFGQSLSNQIKGLSKISTLSYFTQSKVGSKVIINSIEIAVDIAKSSEEKARGLSGRKSLRKNEGMLFVFQNKTRPSFWMKDMFIPIDIIWIAEDKIVGIEKSVPPPKENTSTSKLPLYSPPVGIDYVLEVGGGFCEKYNIEVGNEINLLEI